MTWFSQLLLHSPCARNPEPDESSLLKRFYAAANIPDGYWGLAQTQYFEYPCHAVHNTYEAGILMLCIIAYQSTIVQTHHDVKRLLDLTG